ncbi:MAG: TlpA family protein disulfide reductase [Firmicutes bacterium]|nr:TlpA family protein disulfide reductase [Bacillota bacterium]
MKRLLWYSFLLVIIISLLGAGHLSPAAAEERPLVPDFTLPSARDGQISLSDYEGQVVVLNFWASWCPPCRSEMGELQQLYDHLEAKGEGVLLLLNQIDGQRETVESGTRFLEQNNYEMTNLFDEGQVGLGIFGVPALPTTVIIDPQGYFSSYIMGPTTKEELLGLMEEARQ